MRDYNTINQQFCKVLFLYSSIAELNFLLQISHHGYGNPVFFCHFWQDRFLIFRFHSNRSALMALFFSNPISLKCVKHSIGSIRSREMNPIASVPTGAALQVFCSTVLLSVCAFGFTKTAVLMLTDRHDKTIQQLFHRFRSCPDTLQRRRLRDARGRPRSPGEGMRFAAREPG